MRVWLNRYAIAVIAALGLATTVSLSVAQSPQGQAVQSAPTAIGEPTSQGEPNSEPPPSTAVEDISKVIEAISKCLAYDKEAVLFTDSVDCVSYRKGKDHLKTGHSEAPFDYNSERDCPRDPKTAPPFNGRRLNADAIKRIALGVQRKVGPHGVRIFRAIFCEKVDLVGLDLPFSLVLDKSVFNDGIEIRNVKMRGDLSFDDSFVF